MNKILLTVSLFLLIMFHFGCDQGGDMEGMSEGIITYDATFPSLDPKSVAAGLMPTKITKTFKGHMTRIDMNVGHGLMKSAYISNSKTKTIIILVELFGVKYATIQDAAQTSDIIREMPQFKLEPSDETKTIADIECKLVNATDPSTNTKYEIYYTESIEGGDLNWDNPFSGINGMIMVYPLEYHFADQILEIRLEAIKVRGVKVKDAVFKIPKKYEMVDKHTIDKMLGDLMAMGG